MPEAEGRSVQRPSDGSAAGAHFARAGRLQGLPNSAQVVRFASSAATAVGHQRARVPRVWFAPFVGLVALAAQLLGPRDRALQGDLKPGCTVEVVADRAAQRTNALLTWHDASCLGTHSTE